MIPSRLIQTGKTHNLKLLEQAAVASLRLLNPGFEHIYFSDLEVEAFIDREFPEYRGVFDGFRFPIQKFDFFRYLAVYRLGGFYFDLDVFLAKGVADLTTASCVFPFEELTLSRHLRTQYSLDWEIGNYAFGAEAGNPFMRAVIDNCVRAQKDPAWVAPMMKGIPSWFRGNFEVLNSTGPGLITRTLAEHPDLARKVTVLFPDDVCDIRNWHQFGQYGVHLMAASWRSRSSFLHRRLGLLWEAHTRDKLLRESQRRGKHRTLPAAVST